MRIALVDTTPTSDNSPRLYPIALLKIGAWLKEKGDITELFMDRLPEPGSFEEIWISTLFTFDIPHSLGITIEAMKRARRVRVGGVAATLIPEPFQKTGAEVTLGLIPEAERFVGDYSLLGESPRYSIVHTSRGCVRSCGFCMVRRLEPELNDRPNWQDQIQPGTHKVLFYDNNWLAKPIEILKRDIEKMRALTSRAGIRVWDFNQGLDTRLMTEEIADLLEGIPIKPVRFAFDWKAEDGYYQNAVRLMARRGFSEFMSYMLYNFKDSPADFYYRLKESARLTEELGIQVKSYPMRYQPILEADRNHIGPRWTATMIGAFRRVVAAHSVSGQVSCLGGNGLRPVEEFEY